MVKKTKSKAKGSCRMLPVMHPDAAGVDIGAEEIFVAVPADRDVESVRLFDTFTRDLHQLADWLQSCRVRTVAMESTGVYWIPLYQILEARGFQVFLVNAKGEEPCGDCTAPRRTLPVQGQELPRRVSPEDEVETGRTSSGHSNCS